MYYADRFEVLPGGKKHATPPLTPQYDAIADLPAIPVLAETLLRMELEVRGSATDLRAFTEAVLADVGATIQILRLAGQEFPAAADSPARVEDCISELGPRTCLEAAAKGSFVGMHTHTARQFWVHAEDVAQYFKLFAGLGAPGITPDQAYLTGLLHALGALPAVLGWGNVGLDGDAAQVALALAEQWRFPRFVIDFFGEVLLPGHCPAWAKFVTVAHHPAKESWLECPLAAAQNLSLRRVGRAAIQK
jgi:HD-like signal output (HDOD) protein